MTILRPTGRKGKNANDMKVLEGLAKKDAKEEEENDHGEDTMGDIQITSEAAGMPPPIPEAFQPTFLK